MAKAKSGEFKRHDVVHENGWRFEGNSDSVTGTKQYQPGGAILEITGRTLDEARDAAAAHDQRIKQSEHTP